MTYFKDLSVYEYRTEGLTRVAKTENIGWLESGHAFGAHDFVEGFLDNLWQFCKISVAQTRGIHSCSFCLEDRFFAERGNKKLVLGSAEMRVFSNNGRIFAAPNLIYHYIEFHRYSPPDEFVEAVLNGPQPSEGIYYDRLLEIGLEWRMTSSPLVKPEVVQLL